MTTHHQPPPIRRVKKKKQYSREKEQNGPAQKLPGLAQFEAALSGWRRHGCGGMEQEGSDCQYRHQVAQRDGVPEKHMGADEGSNQPAQAKEQVQKIERRAPPLLADIADQRVCGG